MKDFLIFIIKICISMLAISITTTLVGYIDKKINPESHISLINFFH